MKHDGVCCISNNALLLQMSHKIAPLTCLSFETFFLKQPMSRSCPVPSAELLEADNVEEALPPLNSSILECPYVKRFYSDSGEKRWRCLWCPDLEDGSEDPGLSAHNATKAL